MRRLIPILLLFALAACERAPHAQDTAGGAPPARGRGQGVERRPAVDRHPAGRPARRLWIQGHGQRARGSTPSSPRASSSSGHGAARLDLAVARLAPDRPLPERPRRGRRTATASRTTCRPCPSSSTAPATRPAPSSPTCARRTTRGGTPSPAPAARTARPSSAPSDGRQGCRTTASPFFLWVHLFGAHRPTTTAATWRTASSTRATRGRSARRSGSSTGS